MIFLKNLESEFSYQYVLLVAYEHLSNMRQNTASLLLPIVLEAVSELIELLPGGKM